MNRRQWFGWALGLALLAGAFAGTSWGADLKVGQAAPDFSLPDVASGQSVSLAGLKGKIVVVCFDSVRCPVAAAYRARMGQFYDTYCRGAEGKTPVVFLSVNANENETADEIKTAAEEQHLKYPVLKDAGSKVADAYGGICTPHVFVVDADGKLRYMGAIDDSQKPQRVSKHYLTDAVDALLAGHTVTTSETEPFGCGIHRPR